MKKSIILLAMIVLGMSCSVFAKKLKPITIVNNADSSIFVSWGYNAKQLQSFIVEIGKGTTLKVNDWDVDRPTNIFVYDPIRDNPFGSREGVESGKTINGHIYMMPLGKNIDIKLTKKEVLLSNSIFLRNKDIFTKCDVDGKLTVKPISECNKPMVTKYTPVTDAVFRKFLFSKKFPDKAEQEKLQNLSNKMRDETITIK